MEGVWVGDAIIAEDLPHFINEVCKLALAPDYLKSVILKVAENWQQKITVEREMEDEAWDWDYPTGPVLVSEPEPELESIEPPVDLAARLVPLWDRRHPLNVKPREDGTSIPWANPYWYWKRRNRKPRSRLHPKMRADITAVDCLDEDQGQDRITAAFRRRLGYPPGSQQVKRIDRIVIIYDPFVPRVWHYQIIRMLHLDLLPEVGSYVVLQMTHIVPRRPRSGQALPGDSDTDDELPLAAKSDE